MTRVFWIAVTAIVVGLGPGQATAGEAPDEIARRIADGKPVSLNECVDLALSRNPSVRASAHMVRQREQAVLEVWDEFLPDVSIGGSGTRIKSSNTFGSVTLDTTFNRYGVDLSIRQGIFSYSGLKSIQQSRKNRDAERAGHISTENNLILQVEQGFHGVLEMKDLLEVARENLKVGEEQLKLAEKRKEVGAGVIADVLKAQAHVESNKLDVITAEKNLKSAKASLLYSLGVDLLWPLELVPPQAGDPEVPSYELSLAEAMKNRPDLLQSRLSSGAAHDGVGRSVGEWIPRLDGQFRFGWDANEFSSEIFEDKNEQWTASLSLTVPILDAGSFSRIRQNRSIARAADWELEQKRQSVALEVREAILSIEENVKKMDVAARNIEAAEEDLRVSHGKYKHGLVPILDLIEAQVALATAKSEGVKAFHNYLSSRAELRNAIGRRNQ